MANRLSSKPTPHPVPRKGGRGLVIEMCRYASLRDKGTLEQSRGTEGAVSLAWKVSTLAPQVTYRRFKKRGAMIDVTRNRPIHRR